MRNSCAELYGAVKREAMHCGFFCNQMKLAPLQLAYETNCIVIVVPLTTLAVFENTPDDLGISVHSTEDKNLTSPNGAVFHSE